MSRLSILKHLLTLPLFHLAKAMWTRDSNAISSFATSSRSPSKLHHWVRLSPPRSNGRATNANVDLLQRSGIAWPNGRMVTNPLQANAYLGAAAVANAQMVNGHKRVPSGNGTMAIAGMNAQLPSPPIHLYTHDQNAKFDAMSRSTSAYSAISDSAGPLMYKNGVNPVFTGMPVNAEPKNQPVSFRMTSDQLQSIINAIRSPQEQQAISSSTTMPPPPIPTHAVRSKDLPSDVSSALPQFSASKPTFGSDALNFANKGARAESRYSDISMHAGCNGFPNCTSEDCDGHIVHNAPNAPATVVRGRKEGSSPTKRKLSNKAKKSDRAYKTSRRSSRLLQHDSGHDDDGTSDAGSGGATAAGEGDDDASVVESS